MMLKKIFILFLLLISQYVSAQHYFDRTYGIMNVADAASRICEWQNGGFLFSGREGFSPSGNDDALIWAIDSLGNLVWKKHYGTPTLEVWGFISKGSPNEYFLLTETGETGDTNDYTAFLLFKIDSSGNEIWRRTYNGFRTDWPENVLATRDGGVLMIGSSNSSAPASMNVWLIKTDGNGDTLWTFVYGDKYDDYGFQIIEVKSGGYLAIGEKREAIDSTYQDRISFIRLDAYGDTLWTRNILPYTYSTDLVIDVAELDDGFVAAGTILMKTDLEGNLLWIKEEYNGFAIEATNDGGFIIGNGDYVVGDLWTIRKFDPDGGLEWEKFIPDIIVEDIIQLANGDFVITGGYEDAGGFMPDARVVRTNCMGEMIWDSECTPIMPPETGDLEISVYPNPATDQFSVWVKDLPEGEELSFSIVNNLGQLIKKNIPLSAGENSLNVSGISSGVYHLMIRSASGRFFQREKLIRM